MFSGLQSLAEFQYPSRLLKEAAMPFDGANFPSRRDQPDRATPSDNAACVIIIVVAFSLLVLPVSLNALADIVNYIQSH
jgi:hypothetical protein